MIKISHLFSILGTAIIASGIAACSAEEQLPVRPSQETIQVGGREVPADAFVPGLVQIKVTEALSKSIDIQSDASGLIISTGVKSLDAYIPELKISKIERTFPHAGEYEARTIEAGLHLWYNIHFDQDTPLSRAGESLASVNGVRFMEYRPVTVRAGSRHVAKTVSADRLPVRNSATDLFDDPLLGDQWHYYNDGSFSSIAVSGADINVLPVWKKGIVGTPDVIVAVTDGGIDTEHEDLADNLWSGEDGEGNPINGFDFVNNDYTLEPDMHGTHVAGTIGAINNNGKGVSGIAGGDKKNGIPGVKLMSCQIFSGENAGPGYQAIKWSADHGAVISQNSWGYNHGVHTSVPRVDQEAIDYFIKYAGMDAEGKTQTGPMAGGIVIFASGNDAVSIAFPQSYENCIAVSAITSTGELASYSNFGTWVDISAPGGEATMNGTPIDGVLSTFPGNEYGLISGSSMACPHVSGVAALLVSELGGPGFTPEELRKRLLLNVTPINENNEEKAGLIGSGMVNAEFALSGLKDGGADAITDMTLSAKAEKIDVSFTLPAGKTLTDAYIYLSETELNADNITDAVITIASLDGYDAGDKFTYTVNTGNFHKKYYVAVSTITKDYEMSALSNIGTITTGENSAPSIEALDGETLRVKLDTKSSFRFLVKDADGHRLTPSVSPKFNYITFSYKDGNDTLSLNINGKTAKKGETDIQLILTDEYGKSTTKPLLIIIAENSTPELTGEIPPITFQCIEDEPVVIDLKQYVTDVDDDTFTATYTFTGDEVASLSVEDSKLTVTPLAVGFMTAEIVISDPMGASVITTLEISMTASDTPLTFYPNPVADSLYIRANEGRAEGQVTLYSPTGAVVYSDTIEIGSTPVDMTGFPAGVYSVKVLYKEKEIQSRIVKL